MSVPSAQTDRYVHDRLPPREQWPEFRYDLPELRIPDQANLVTVLFDAARANGWSNRLLLRSPGQTLTYAETEAQDAMVTNFAAQLDSEIVRIPDHAGPGWSQDFIDLVAASMEVGIVSVGDNDIGYPDPATLAAWEATGAPIYTTQNDGHVLVTADGDDLVVETFPTE